MSLSFFSTPFLLKTFVDNGEATILGRIGTISTAAILISSLATAYFSDRYRRDVMIWLGILPYIMGLWLLSTANQVNDVLLGQVLISIGWGLSGSAQNALIADSTPVKERNSVYGWVFWFNNVFFGGGNVIGFFLYQKAGSDLNLALLHFAMRLSLIMMIIGCIFVMFVRDKYRIPATNDQIHGSTIDERRFESFSKQGKYIVLTLIVSTSVLIGFGAGLSIPFFPYFFNDLYAVNLANLSLIFASMQIFTGFIGKWLTSLGTKFGRVKMIVSTQMIAVILLYTLTAYPPLSLAIIAMLTRNATMNAAGPLVNVMLVDNTPRNKRARITTLGAVAWSISNGLAQSLGGMLIDSHGYRYVFFITATFYLIATLWITSLRRKESSPVLEDLSIQ